MIVLKSLLALHNQWSKFEKKWRTFISWTALGKVGWNDLAAKGALSGETLILHSIKPVPVKVLWVVLWRSQCELPYWHAAWWRWKRDLASANKLLQICTGTVTYILTHTLPTTGRVKYNQTTELLVQYNKTYRYQR